MGAGTGGLAAAKSFAEKIDRPIVLLRDALQLLPRLCYIQYDQKSPENATPRLGREQSAHLAPIRSLVPRVCRQ